MRRNFDGGIDGRGSDGPDGGGFGGGGGGVHGIGGCGDYDRAGRRFLLFEPGVV